MDETNKECLLTTTDNPYNPFDDFKHWYLYDIQSGHNTCELVARLSFVSDEMSEKEIQNELIRVYDDIIKNVDFMGIYKKIYA